MISPFDTGMPSEGGQPSLSLGRLHHAPIGFSGAYTTTNAYAEAQHNQFSFRSGQSPRGNALSQQAASTGVMSGVLPTVESDQRRENRPLNLMYSSKVIQQKARYTLNTLQKDYKQSKSNLNSEVNYNYEAGMKVNNSSD